MNRDGRKELTFLHISVVPARVSKQTPPNTQTHTHTHNYPHFTDMGGKAQKD